MDHCADVAACAEALLRETSLGARLARLAGLTAFSEVQIQRLCVLAALHDLGKFNHGFQQKARQEEGRTAGHVVEALGLFKLSGAVGDRFVEVTDPLVSWVSEDEHLDNLLAASIAHHGRPIDFEKTSVPGLEALWRPRNGVDPLGGVEALLAAAQAWFPLAFEPGGGPLPAGSAFLHGLNGWVSLADWLGSDTLFFPYAEAANAPRFAASQARAQAAVARVGLSTSMARQALGEPGFRHLGATFAPRPVQAAMAHLPTPAAGSLTIIEAPTGEGKTEAAFFAWLRLFAAGVVDGLYFALPTRTAAVEIFKRIKDLVATALPADVRPPVIQAVPGYLRVDEATGQRPGEAHGLSPYAVLWDDDGLRGRGWAAESPKRYLAGGVVVGTIDQVLLAGLQVKHAHLRSAGLLRLLLIVDEVHASDAYMAALLTGVLRRHQQAGGHALLLSATLGGEARAKLLDKPAPDLAAAVAAPYPLVSGTDVSPQAPETSATNRKRVRWSLQPWAADADALVARAWAAAEAGGHVLIIRNTVRDALATQAALEASVPAALLFGLTGSPALHHSRFCRTDRLALDAAIQQAFGKGRPGQGLIAVGTQTLEQSLDLDADLLLTDLCPVDVLLQRIGRLHRHQAARPAGFETAAVEVLIEEDPDLTRFLRPKGQARGPHGWGTVYRDLRVLEATRRLIDADAVITTPDDCRRLVEQAVHSEALRAIESDLPALRPHGLIVGTAEFVQERTASLVRLDWARPFGADTFGELEARAATRLGLDDREVDFPAPVPAAFGGSFAQINLPARQLPEDLPDRLTAENLVVGDSSVRFTVAGRLFTYSARPRSGVVMTTACRQ
ncbi:MAG: CRISPR-associated helicase Cas3' [bacterium]